VEVGCVGDVGDVGAAGVVLGCTWGVSGCFRAVLAAGPVFGLC
jgi:hypothetical protein